MFPYERLHEIFTLLQKNDYISARELADRFDVTDRTIRTDIQEINALLGAHGAGIDLKRKRGYYIEVYDCTAYEQFTKSFTEPIIARLDTSRDRIRYILYLLLSSDSYTSTAQIMNTVFISKNTLNNYMREIKKILDQYQLEYVSRPNSGIKIIGEEKNKRRCILNRIITEQSGFNMVGFTKNERLLFKNINLDSLKRMTLAHLNAGGIRISDFNIRNLIIHLALMITRIQSDHYITPIDLKLEPAILEIVSKLCGDIEINYHISVSKGERMNLYLHLISNAHIETADIDDEWLTSHIRVVLDNIYKNYHFDLRQDGVLAEDLFRHMKSVFTNKFFSLDTRNPLLNTIKSNYPLAFEVTLTTLTEALKDAPFRLTEEDIGYISVHIGAAIERYFASHLAPKNVLLLCGSGQATTRMLETQLYLYFPGKLNIVGFCSYNEYCHYGEQDVKNIDFVISTIPLDQGRLPSITVNFSMKNKDVEAISRFLNHIGARDSNLSEFFDRNLFFLQKKAAGKEELLQMMCRELWKEGIADEQIFELVMERENLGNTNMDEAFALAHPMKLCASATKAAVAILEEPVRWNRKDSVRIVFLLAVKPGVQKGIEHLYDIFIELVSNITLQQKIIHTRDYDEFITLLSSDFAIRNP